MRLVTNRRNHNNVDTDINNLNHNELVKMLFKIYFIKDLRTFCKVNGFEVLASASDKKKFVKEYLLKIGIIDRNEKTTKVQMTSSQYNYHNTVVFDFVDGEESCDDQKKGVDRGLTKEADEKVDKNLNETLNHNSCLKRKNEDGYSHQNEEEINNVPHNVVVSKPKSLDEKLSSDHSSLGGTTANDEVQVLAKSFFPHNNDTFIPNNNVIESEKDPELMKLTPFAKQSLKLALKIEKSLTYPKICLMRNFPHFLEEDKAILKKYFGIKDKVLTKTMFETSDDFVDNLSPKIFNAIYERFSHDDYLEQDGLKWADVTVGIDSQCSQREKKFIDSYFGKDFTTRPTKRMKTTTIPEITTNESTHQFEGIETFPSSPPTRNIITTSSCSNSIIGTPPSLLSLNTPTSATDVITHESHDYVKVSDDNLITKKSIQANLNDNKKKYKGKSYDMEMKPYKVPDSEDRSSKEIQATLECRITEPLIYKNAVRYMIQVHWPKNNRDTAPYFGFQAYYLKPAIENTLKEMKSRLSYPFNEESYDFNIITYGECIEPCSNEFKVHSGKNKRTTYRRYNLFFLVSIKGLKFLEWEKLLGAIVHQKTQLEKLLTTFMRHVLDSKHFEFFYVNEFETKDHDKEKYAGSLKPMTSFSEYPKASIKQYLGGMSRKIASTRQKPSQFFKTLKECDFSFHYDLQLYHVMTPSNLEEFMRSIHHDPNNVSEQHDKVFQTTKWFLKDYDEEEQ